MQSKATTVASYLKELPPERREAVATVRSVILRNLPDGFVEGMDYGMISYAIPLERFPDTYNGHPLGVVGLASQKHYLSVYLMCVYGDKASQKWFESEYKKSGKKLDMGKSCIRFRRAEDLALDVIGQAVARWSADMLIEAHEAAHGTRGKKGRRR